MYQSTKRYIEERIPGNARIAIVLGSGLGEFASELTQVVEIPYAEIPGWPRSTAVGHAGKFLFGHIDEVPLIVLSGRAHLYEGYSAGRVTYAMRILHLLGVRSVILTNAAGGINPAYRPGALIVIADHINLQGVNPLAGANEDDFGPRFPDMSEAYSAEYRSLALEVGNEQGIVLSEGVYAGLLGPSYETPAEIRYLRTIGADLVGMSTVAESIVANHMGMKVLAISSVTNMAAGMLPQKINHEEVLEAGRKVRETLVRLLRGTISRIAALEHSGT